MDYLLELGTEEIPARLLRALGVDLRERLVEGLSSRHLAPAGGAELFLTPRRLAVRLGGLPEGQEDRTEQVLGPPAKVAFDEEGAPTRAAEGFARSKGADPGALARVTTDKGEYAALTLEVEGRGIGEILQEVVPEAVTGLHLPVSMRWNRGQGPFVRAVRWVVSLLDEEVLPLELYGLEAGRATRGHRVLGPGPHDLAAPGEYERVLRAAGVEPDPGARRRAIQEALDRLAGEAGADPAAQHYAPELLEVLVMISEHPVTILGHFDDRFLALPRELIDTAMRHHQKMFSVRGEEDRLLPSFLTVVNNDDPEGRISAGQRQVLEARLHDAEFFWARDRERGLEAAADELDRVVFQERLGSYADKIDRMRQTAEELSDELTMGEAGVEPLLRAIALCKADLCTLTVGEFPELQGVTGSLLAAAEGAPPEVHLAIRHHYAPFEAPEEAARRPTVPALALLDGADTLLGCHGVGLSSTGSKDPFGLRRAASTVARLLAEGGPGADVAVDTLLDAVRRSLRSVEGFQGDEAMHRTLDLLRARLRFHLEEELGFPYDEVNAVFAGGWKRPADAVARLRAVHELREEAALEELAVPLKRIRNILRDAEGDGIEGQAWQKDLLEDPAEEALAEELGEGRSSIEASLAEGSYRAALRRLAALRPAVDRFFEEVLVMAENDSLRANRLRLLAEVRDLFLEVGDLGEIVEGGTAQNPSETSSG